MNGLSSRATASKNYPTDWALTRSEALLLLGSGALIVVLKRLLSHGLGLPGHHGIEWMALLLLARASSRYRAAGSLVGVAASLTVLVPGLRSGDAFAWLLYLLPGPLLDAAFRYAPQVSTRPWALVLLGGLAHLTKPLARLALAGSFGWAYDSFRTGILYPLVSHFVFGLAGGLLAALIILATHKAAHEPPA